MENLEKIIDKLHQEDLRNDIHPSFFDENDKYDMLIIRIPIIKEELEVKSIGFVLTSNKSYLFNKDKKIFEELGERFDGPYRFTDKILDEFLKSFLNYSDRISDIEELLYEDKFTTNFMKSWIELKRDIVRIERILRRASIVMNEVIKFYEKKEEFPINSYIDLHEHMERTMRSAELQLSKLDYLYSFYTARTNDKMNKMIYLLTIISAIFLPLNLVVGFFGMNTSGLPFANGTNGTLSAIFLMTLLLVASLGILYLWKTKTDNS